MTEEIVVTETELIKELIKEGSLTFADYPLKRCKSSPEQRAGYHTETANFSSLSSSEEGELSKLRVLW